MKMDEIIQKVPTDERGLMYDTLPMEQMLADTEQVLVEFAEDYKRMA